VPHWPSPFSLFVLPSSSQDPLKYVPSFLMHSPGFWGGGVRGGGCVFLRVLGFWGGGWFGRVGLGVLGGGGGLGGWAGYGIAPRAFLASRLAL